MGRQGRRLLLCLVLCARVGAAANGLVGKSPPGKRDPVQLRLQGAARAAAQSAIAGAQARLRESSCRSVLGDFATAEGQLLQERLEALGMEPDDYLMTLVFVDGDAQKACASGRALAGTRPGSQVVSLCSRAFTEAERRNSRLAEAIVIHEMLHTLGLGEDPPQSRQITAKVLERCGHRPPLRALR
jgi:hypothetical protein